MKAARAVRAHPAAAAVAAAISRLASSFLPRPIVRCSDISTKAKRCKFCCAPVEPLPPSNSEKQLQAAGEEGGSGLVAALCAALKALLPRTGLSRMQC